MYCKIVAVIMVIQMVIPNIVILIVEHNDKTEKTAQTTASGIRGYLLLFNPLSLNAFQINNSNHIIVLIAVNGGKKLA